MKCIPVLLNHDIEKLIGHITITDESFETLLKTASRGNEPTFKLGWSMSCAANEIVALSFNVDSSLKGE